MLIVVVWPVAVSRGIEKFISHPASGPPCATSLGYLTAACHVCHSTFAGRESVASHYLLAAKYLHTRVLHLSRAATHLATSTYSHQPSQPRMFTPLPSSCGSQTSSLDACHITNAGIINNGQHSFLVSMLPYKTPQLNGTFVALRVYLGCCRDPNVPAKCSVRTMLPSRVLRTLILLRRLISRLFLLP